MFMYIYIYLLFIITTKGFITLIRYIQIKINIKIIWNILFVIQSISFVH